MLTWLFIGYLVIALLTGLFVYAAAVVAARADGMQEQRQPRTKATYHPAPTSARAVEALALSTM